MASTNSDLVRSAYAAWNRGDLEALLELVSPRFEFHNPRAFADSKAVYRGREGYAEFWHTFREAWAEITIDVRRVEDLGDGRLLVLFLFDGKGRGSGVGVSMRYGNVWTFSDGLATRVEGFASWDEALTAAGVPGVSKQGESAR